MTAVQATLDGFGADDESQSRAADPSLELPDGEPGQVGATDRASGPATGLAGDQLYPFVRAEVDGRISDEDLATLEENKGTWAWLLRSMLDEVDDHIDAVRDLPAEVRSQVGNDLEAERSAVERALVRVVDPDRAAMDQQGADGIQASWVSGRVVVWATGPSGAAEELDALAERLSDADAPVEAFEPHVPVPVPGAAAAPSMSAPLEAVLGWLVAVGSDPHGLQVAPSAAWLGRIAISGVRMVAEGRMIPRLMQRATTSDRPGRGSYGVVWQPALTTPEQMDRLAAHMPTAVTAIQQLGDSRVVATAVLTAVVDGICTNAAGRLEVPAPPPDPSSPAEVGECVLGHLDGGAFTAPNKAGTEIVRRMERWAKPASGSTKLSLVIQLEPPDEVGAWYLSVRAPGPDKTLEPVEVAMVTGSTSRSREVKDQMKRLEKLLPELQRPGGQRRGEVILSQDEAWTLMTETGPTLTAAGYDVRVPKLSRRRPSAGLRLSAEESAESVVGAQQLANVRWSAVFDDVELDAAEIGRLAAQARPLVKSRGQWVELDHADLQEAAAALAERSSTTQLTGAEMLRHAMGLEGGHVSGGVSISGEGWAADLLRSASTASGELDRAPEGFEGELRSYQADALAWLGFLSDAGLGGCLALDMGLGKTPTLLAHIRLVASGTPSLVIAPPAVVGNWAAEARRFVPELKVLVHHGPNRDSGMSLIGEIERHDLVLTTYGTAVRDIETLTKVSWDRVALDEAQVIKNPTSETAIQLRRLEAAGKIALTGTPIENGLGDLWAIMDFANPGLVGARGPFIKQMSVEQGAEANAERALKALNGVLVFRRTKAEPAIAAELPDRIDELDHCVMTPEQIGLYQAVLDSLVKNVAEEGPERKGAVLAAITALKQICNHPAAYQDDGEPLEGRSGKLDRLNEIMDTVYAANERILIFTHFASWGEKLADYLTERTGERVECYHGGLARGARDRMIDRFQDLDGPGALVLSLKAGGTGLNLTGANHVVLYDRWWNPAVEDQARDRVWRIGQTRTVVCHRLVCPGTVDERVEEVVAGKRRIADMVLPKSSSVGDLDAAQLGQALGLDPDALLAADEEASPT